MNNIDLNLLCTVCLTRNSEMIPLQYTFNEAADSENYENYDIVIKDALSDLFKYTEAHSEKCPQHICSMCLGILKISYDFKILFEESHQVILECIGEPFVPDNSSSTNSQRNSSVELIVGTNKYDLNDLVIVEQENSIEEDNFGGFLKNLGTAVSATFTTTKLSKIPERNSPVIELVRELEENDLNNFIVIADESQSHSSQVGYSRDDLIKSAMNLKYECTVCQRVYSSKTRFQKHTNACGNTKLKSLKSKFQCKYCLKWYSSVKCLKYHLKSHDNLIYLSCEFCDQKFKTRSSLKYHKASKHGESSYVCQVCGKKFAVATTLNAHIQIHDRNKTRCICPVCGKSFHYKGGLFYHMKQHTNERKYHCDYCDKTFYTLTAKKRHTLTHTGTRPYECQFCQKRFFSSGELKKHVYIHTGVLPYKCKYCGKGFRSSFNMKVHWFNHYGNSVCDYCYRGFISNEVLVFHCKMKHKNLAKKKKEAVL